MDPQPLPRATAAASRGESLPFSPPLTVARPDRPESALTAEIAPLGSFRRQSPRVSTKPVRECYVDISQPGLSFATPKGGIKKGDCDSLADQAGYASGDVVWAKMKGFPAWPAQVQSVETKASGAKATVVFFATGDTASVAFADVTPFADGTRLRAKSKAKKFALAVAEAEQAVGPARGASSATPSPSADVKSFTFASPPPQLSASKRKAAAVVASEAGAADGASAGHPRKSPRVSTKPVREGYVDISQPGLSFATPKGGIKKGDSLADLSPSKLPGAAAAAKETMLPPAAVNRAAPTPAGADAAPVAQSAAEPTAGSRDEGPPLATAELSAAGIVEAVAVVPSAEAATIMPEKATAADDFEATEAAPMSPDADGTEDKAAKPVLQPVARVETQAAESQQEKDAEGGSPPRTQVTEQLATQVAEAACIAPGVEKRKQAVAFPAAPPVAAAASPKRAVVTKQRKRPRQQQAAAKKPEDDDDEDDDDDMPVSQLRLRHLLLRSPSRSKKKRCKRLPSSQQPVPVVTKVQLEISPERQQHDSDDEVPLFILKVKGKHGDDKPKPAAATIASPDGGRYAVAAAAAAAAASTSAVDLSPSGRPLRASRSPVNYDELKLATTSRPIYLDWRGEAGQDPTESGTNYAIRMGVSPDKPSQMQRHMKKLASTSQRPKPEPDTAPAPAPLEIIEAEAVNPLGAPKTGGVPELDVAQLPGAAKGDASEQKAVPVWECAAVIGKRKGGGILGTEYLVKWKGRDASENSWEPVSQLSNASEAIAQYERRLQVAKAAMMAAAVAEAPSPEQAPATDAPAAAAAAVAASPLSDGAKLRLAAGSDGRSPSATDSDDEMPMRHLRQKLKEKADAEIAAEDAVHRDAYLTKAKRREASSPRPAATAAAAPQSVARVRQSHKPVHVQERAHGGAQVCMAEQEATALLQAVIYSQRERRQSQGSGEAPPTPGGAPPTPGSGQGQLGRTESSSPATAGPPNSAGPAPAAAAAAAPSSSRRAPPTPGGRPGYGGSRPGLPPGAVRRLVNRLQPPGIRPRPRSAFFNRPQPQPQPQQVPAAAATTADPPGGSAAVMSQSQVTESLSTMPRSASSEACTDGTAAGVTEPAAVVAEPAAAAAAPVPPPEEARRPSILCGGLGGAKAFSRQQLPSAPALDSADRSRGVVWASSSELSSILEVGVTEAELEERRACQREISARIAAMRSAIMG